LIIWVRGHNLYLQLITVAIDYTVWGSYPLLTFNVLTVDIDCAFEGS